jgi:menaquinone-dependent protoporphyrinogen IX oxidase
MRLLVAFHSRTGYTRRVAEMLAGECNGVVDEICPLREHRGFTGYLRCAFEARAGHIPPILPPRHDPGTYELVIIGTPIWAWSLASPVRTYLHGHGPALKRVAFYCTMGGAGAENAFNEMRELCGRAPLATLALTKGQIDAHRLEAPLEAFVRALD